MRRPRFNLMSLLSLASLILCLALGVLWGRNTTTEEGCNYTLREDIVWVSVNRGRLVLSYNGDCSNRPEDHLGLYWYGRTTPSPLPDDGIDNVSASYQTYAWHGFSYENNESGPHSYRSVTLPMWLACLLCFVVPLRWAMALRRARLANLRSSLCVHCGYDLRATPGRCPECGRVP